MAFNLDEPIVDTLARWEEWLKEKLGPVLGGIKESIGGALTAIKESPSKLVSSVNSMVSPSPSAEKTPSIEKSPSVEKTPSVEPSVGEKLSPETLASVKDFGQAIKTGKLPEGATFSKANTVEIASNFSVDEISAPTATPNPRFGQQQVGMGGVG
jgi:hypothetical protein